MDRKIPVSVFTGFLGSGKTTIILNTVAKLPKGYKVVLLKNEFGNIKVDSQIAKEKNIEVMEFVNGCLCCVLIGKMQDALNEILEKYSPDRIIIETSGSAYPGPIAWEIRNMGDKLYLDSIVTVIDAVNFPGYKDKSFTAKLQAEETDIILINKHELTTEHELDKLLDDVYELNPHTPKVKTQQGSIDPDLVFGLDTKLFAVMSDAKLAQIDEHHHEKEVDIFEVVTDKVFTKTSLIDFLEDLPKSDFYRIKGLIHLKDGHYLLNYVFGKFALEKLHSYKGITKIVFMGRDFFRYKNLVKSKLGLGDHDITTVQEKRID